jgi:hypothetical protein
LVAYLQNFLEEYFKLFFSYISSKTIQRNHFKEPLLPGDSDLNQLVKIFDLFGTPNETNCK